MSDLVIGMDGRFLQDKFHGIGRYLFGLVSGLAALAGRHRIVLFVDPSLPNARFSLDALRGGEKVRIVPISTPLYSPRELWEWPLILSRVPVHLFHSPYFWAPLSLRTPLVTTVHDMIFDRYPQYTPGPQYMAAYRVMSRLAMGRARRIVAVSEATRQDILRFTSVKGENVVTVLEGVDTRFRPIDGHDERARVRAKYGLPAAYVLALGVRRPHKNIACLVSAFARCATQAPQTLVLVGASDARFNDTASAAIEALRHAERLVEIANVDEADLPALYSQADLFVQPSLIEGFGLPVLEAMSCGCAVACSNTSSLPEVAGDAAALFNPRSEQALAETLGMILASPGMRQDLRERGLRQAARFSWAVAAERTLAVYREALASS